MRTSDAARRLDQHGNTAFGRHGPALDQLVERLAFEQLHCNKAAAFFGGAVLIDVNDVGMRELGGVARFAAKSLHHDVIASERRSQNLQRNHTVGEAQFRAVHCGHAAGAE
jgi:uncharacterized protein CbrC (UPF0167 family)